MNKWLNEWINKWMYKWMTVTKTFYCYNLKKKENNFFSQLDWKKLWKLAKMNEIMNDRVNEWIENEWIVPKYCFTYMQ